MVGLGEPLPTQDPNQIRKVTVNTDKDEVTATMSRQLFEQAQKSLTFYNDAMVGMQKELDRSYADEAKARSVHPVIGVIQKLAANMAMQPDQPGYVRALGMTSAQLNPDADMVAARRVPLLQQIAEMQNRKAATAGQLAQIGLSFEAKRGAEEDRSLFREQSALTKAEAEKTRKQSALSNFADRGQLTPDLVYEILGPDTKPEVVKAWVGASEQKGKELREKAAAERASTQQLTLLNAARIEDISNKNAIATAKLDLAKELGQARAEELGARAYQHFAQGGYREAQRDAILQGMVADTIRIEKGLIKDRAQFEIALANTLLDPAEKKARMAAFEARMKGVEKKNQDLEAAGRRREEERRQANESRGKGHTNPNAVPDVVPYDVRMGLARAPVGSTATFGGVLWEVGEGGVIRAKR